MNTPIKRLFQLFTTLLIIGLIGFLILTYFTYSPNEENSDVLTLPNVIQTRDYYVINPFGEATANFVFYQGGLVRTDAYLTFAHEMSEAGIRVYLPKMPLNLAILDRFAFNDMFEDDGLPWYVGGHSLGGASAAYVAEKHEHVNGLILLAAYPPSAVDLSNHQLSVLSIVGSEDEVLDWELYEDTKALLPSDSIFEIIYGGNHAYFGAYGTQRGDGNAWVSNAFQIRRTVELISGFISDSE